MRSHAPSDTLNLPVVAHQGRPVLTTELLARAYSVQDKVIHDGFARNEDRFVEGVHFFRLTGDALADFKNYPAHSGLVGQRAPHLLLWTERGAARHAKLISTDAAWSVFGTLEDTYFDRADGLGVDDLPVGSPAAIAHESTSVFRSFFDVAMLVGYDKPIAALSANRAAQKLTGLDVLATMGTTHLVSERQERVLTPTDIGVDMDGLSGIAVNRLLVEHGFQTETRDAKGKPIKQPTETGQPFAVWVDSGKRHGDGSPVHQLKWAATVIPALQSAITQRQPLEVAA